MSKWEDRTTVSSTFQTAIVNQSLFIEDVKYGQTKPTYVQ